VATMAPGWHWFSDANAELALKNLLKTGLPYSQISALSYVNIIARKSIGNSEVGDLHLGIHKTGRSGICRSHRPM